MSPCESFITENTRHKDGITHPVDNLLLSWDDGREDAVEGGIAFVIREVVGAETHATFHDLHLASIFIPIGVTDAFAFVKPLQNVRVMVEAFDGSDQGGGPFILGEVLSNADASASPGKFRVATDLQYQLTLTLREIGELAPRVDIETGNDGVMGQGRGMTQDSGMMLRRSRSLLARSSRIQCLRSGCS